MIASELLFPPLAVVEDFSVTVLFSSSPDLNIFLAICNNFFKLN
jgi:hypothetical protein